MFVNKIDISIAHKQMLEAIVKIGISDRSFEFDEEMESRDLAIKARFIFRDKKNRTHILGYFEVDYISKVIEGCALDSKVSEILENIIDLMPEYIRPKFISRWDESEVEQVTSEVTFL